MAASAVDCHYQWAIARVSVACMRTLPGHAQELSSQITMGTPLRLIEKTEGWWLVESPEGYSGYVKDNSLALKSDTEMESWRSAKRVVVVATDPVKVFASTNGRTERDIVSDLIYGAIVEDGGSANGGAVHKVVLPDGRRGYVDAAAVADFDEWCGQAFDAGKILNTAHSFMGMPYLWGGTTARGMDCSGYVKVCYFGNGIILRRDASEQALTGKDVGDDWKKFRSGDLMFFGNPETGRITHVGIYDADGYYIHCAGRVMRNSLDRSSCGYDPGNCLVKAVRIDGYIGAEGIWAAKDHPWYFNKAK